jgi:hypothetical protein
MRPRPWPLLALFLLRPAAAAHSESLAEASARVKEQPPAETPKVFTNEDLRPGEPTPRPTPRNYDAAPTATPEPLPDVAASESAAQRQVWSGRASGLRAATEAARAALSSAQQALDTARSPFNTVTPRGYGNPDLPKLEAAVEEAKTQLAAAEKAVTDFAEEARRSAIPPGWIESR